MCENLLPHLLFFLCLEDHFVLSLLDPHGFKPNTYNVRNPSTTCDVLTANIIYPLGHCQLRHVVRRPIYVLYNNKDADRPAQYCSLISALDVRCLDNTLRTVVISKPKAEQTGVSLTG